MKCDVQVGTREKTAEDLQALDVGESDEVLICVFVCVDVCVVVACSRRSFGSSVYLDPFSHSGPFLSLCLTNSSSLNAW